MELLEYCLNFQEDFILVKRESVSKTNYVNMKRFKKRSGYKFPKFQYIRLFGLINIIYIMWENHFT